MFPYFIPPWAKAPFFPDDLAPDDTGLVALGGLLSPPVLIEAYSKGIFPWSGQDPVPWYSPDPRLVLYPDKLHVSKRLQRLIKQEIYEIKYDKAFQSVIFNCATISRKDEQGTWIDNNIIQAYSELHQQRIAHSVEVYSGGKLVGGLYGLYLGKCFFGESMFSREANVSKLALYYLCEKLISIGGKLIDCQQETPHMLSMGAELISRKGFHNLISKSVSIKGPFSLWD